MRKYSLIFSLLFILVFQVAVQAQTPTSPPTATPTPIPNTISGYIYNDLNLNKQWDTDTEPGLSSVPISIEGPTNLTSASASDGYYIFMNLTQGTYTIVPNFEAMGFTASSPATLTVIIDAQGVQNILFGGRPAAPTPTTMPSPTSTMTPTPSPTAAPTNTPEPAPTPTPGNACSLNVDPYQDQAGATFTFVGAAFSSDSSVALGLALPDGSVEGLPAQQANSAGSIGFSYTTQSGDQVGLYTMIAEGSGDDKTCRTSAAFYVDDAPPPTAVKVVVQPAQQTPTPEATDEPTPTATPMPLLTNSSAPLLFGIDLAPLDESVLVIKQGSVDDDPGADIQVDEEKSLPGIGGGQGFELQIYPYESLEPQTQLAVKKEATISVWTLLIGLSALLLTGSLILLRKRLKPVVIITGVVLISLMMSTLLLAQDDLGTAGKGKSRIEGFVINADSDSPPAGGESITVLVNGWLPIQSGTDGEWNITDLGAGNYTIELIDLPAGINPKQPVQTVYVNGLESDVQHLNLEYYTGPAVTALPTEAITDTRVAALGADPTATPLAEINTTETLTATGSSTDTAQLPGISGGGPLPNALPTPKVDYTLIISWILAGLTLVMMIAWIYFDGRRKDGEI